MGSIKGLIGDCGAGVMVISVGIGDCCISEFGCGLVAEVSRGVGSFPGGAAMGLPQRGRLDDLEAQQAHSSASGLSS